MLMYHLFGALHFIIEISMWDYYFLSHFCHILLELRSEFANATLRCLGIGRRNRMRAVELLHFLL